MFAITKFVYYAKTFEMNDGLIHLIYISLQHFSYIKNKFLNHC